MNIPAPLLVVITLLQAAGAQVLVMGGAVVDWLLGRQPQDWDVEVHGVPVQDVQHVLANYDPKLVGGSHEALRFIADGVAIDITVPNCDAKEAARRRDLTINSLYFDVERSLLVDGFDGEKDLRAGVLRHTSETFAKYPVNVLRVAQFLSRGKGHTVADETLSLACQLTPENLPAEQVYNQLTKLLLGSHPELGLAFLAKVGWLRFWPELDALTRTEENPDWHPEGNAWDHTMAVVHNAAIIREQLPEEWRLAFMYATLLHDTGKPAVAIGDLSYKGHDMAGGPLAEAFMLRIRAAKDLVEKVKAIVENHMQPGGLQRGEARVPAWKRLHNKCRLDVLGWHSRCDWAANPSRTVLDECHAPSQLAFTYFKEFGVGKVPPKLQGRDILAAGIKPGPQIGKALAAAYDAQLENPDLTNEQLVEIALRAVK